MWLSLKSQPNSIHWELNSIENVRKRKNRKVGPRAMKLTNPNGNFCPVCNFWRLKLFLVKRYRAWYGNYKPMAFNWIQNKTLNEIICSMCRTRPFPMMRQQIRSSLFRIVIEIRSSVWALILQNPNLVTTVRKNDGWIAKRTLLQYHAKMRIW